MQYLGPDRRSMFEIRALATRFLQRRQSWKRRAPDYPMLLYCMKLTATITNVLWDREDRRAVELDGQVEKG